MEYSKLDKNELRRILAEQYVIYHRFKNLGLSYDMTRLRASCLWRGPPYGSLPFSRISLATVCLLTRMLRPT